ncbi:hypothetical protein [Pseudofrankia sp. DC12]|uniref:hypothetical protein n=1 Tax=Pseudofrankia sp. DC12 TaxID=683315 RepID=UPI001E3E9645|nr:hypothetical protein [Pseudofrankia sp. DC12]
MSGSPGEVKGVEASSLTRSFDHREQAQALATLIVDRHENDGWDGARLTPLVAGLREVMP